jgi:hypothetical protein
MPCEMIDPPTAESRGWIAREGGRCGGGEKGPEGASAEGSVEVAELVLTRNAISKVIGERKGMVNGRVVSGSQGR